MAQNNSFEEGNRVIVRNTLKDLPDAVLIRGNRDYTKFNENFVARGTVTRVFDGGGVWIILDEADANVFHIPVNLSWHPDIAKQLGIKVEMLFTKEIAVYDIKRSIYYFDDRTNTSNEKIATMDGTQDIVGAIREDLTNIFNVKVAELNTSSAFQYEYLLFSEYSETGFKPAALVRYSLEDTGNKVYIKVDGVSDSEAQ